MMRRFGRRGSTVLIDGWKECKRRELLLLLLWRSEVERLRRRMAMVIGAADGRGRGIVGERGRGAEGERA